jgi:hypothetical protein
MEVCGFIFVESVGKNNTHNNNFFEKSSTMDATI